MTTVGRESVRQLKHGHILLQADAGQSDSVIAERVGVSVPTVGRIRKRYVTEGLAVAISDKQRSGRPPGISAKTKATITALACSTPPAGESVDLAVISRQSR
ncbi:MAG: helix-turn-helix domain-containing protein [Caldilineaceae bacterium]